ncbi:conserved protein of unknown function [Magnetospirillum sp. XM-1]|uniref:hypothetical protein n=1 Tax=Magnetospirillum sp. XM-1 TaxID=1663591 RepID=UPI00073E0B0A|nr:hypothetical protein [Magnetospirillum sp. XM-1]CUW39698.1 conserved protein of unknown function [Magnetospirillum sp. XM-1]
MPRTTTPGPWKITEPDNGIYDNTDDEIANVTAIGPYGTITLAEEIDIADARLIAAAPDLLAALERVARKIDKASGSPKFTADEHEKLATLIAKARGEGN